MKHSMVPDIAGETTLQDGHWRARLADHCILTEVGVERARQDRRWGEQNHPDGTGAPGAREAAASAREICDRANEHDAANWSLILLEEVAEAIAETDPVKLRAELVQVAAVAVNWIGAIDRRTGGVA